MYQEGKIVKHRHSCSNVSLTKGQF